MGHKIYRQGLLQFVIFLRMLERDLHAILRAFEDACFELNQACQHLSSIGHIIIKAHVNDIFI